MSIKSNRGATLVELMTSIAIFGIIAAAALGLLLYATNINSDITAEVIETNRVYQALDFVKTVAAESTYINVSQDTQTVNIEAGVLEWNGETKKVSYFVGGGGDGIVLLENVTSFDFVDDGNGLEGNLKYLTLKIVTSTGNDYTITVSCKNG